jgi:hypothetical protein
MKPGKAKFHIWFMEGVAVSISAHLAAWLAVLSTAGLFKFLGHVAGVTAVNFLVYGP